MQYFFTNSKEFLAMAEEGKDLGFDLYEPKHLIWLAAIIIAAWLISSWYKGLGQHRGWGGSNAIDPPQWMKGGSGHGYGGGPGNGYGGLSYGGLESGDTLAGNRQQSMVRKVFAVVLLLSEIYKDSILAITGNFRTEYLPFHLCGIAIFGILIDAFAEKQRVTGQLFAYAFMPGAVSALLFCNWTEYPFFNFMNIHSFLFHGWIVCYVVMELRSGRIRPSYRGIWQSAGLLAVLAIPLFQFNKAFGTNFMFLNVASEGSPLVILWDLFGTKYGYPGYLAAAAVMVIAVFHVLWLVYRLLGLGSGRRG